MNEDKLIRYAFYAMGFIAGVALAMAIARFL